jgi:TPR repeat protein
MFENRKLKLSLMRAANVILTLSSSTPVAAGPYEDAIAAYNSGDYATALQRLHRLAEQGDCVAQYKLGFMYERGQGG